MRKTIFTILALCGAMAAQAAVSVSYNGAPVADGSTVELGREVLKSMEDIPGYEVAEKMQITGDLPMTITATSDSQTFTYCTQQCFSLISDGNGKFTHTSQVKDLPCDLMIDATFPMVQEIPDVNTSIEFKLVSGAESLTFTVHLDTSNSAVKEIANHAKTVSFKGNRLYLNSDHAAAYTIYGVSGKAVKSGRVSAHGSVDLGALPKGIYLYRVDNRTGKVIVK